MIPIVLSILPVLLFFGLGFLLKSRSFFKQESLGDIKKIVSNLALPALLFNAFSGLHLQWSSLLLIFSIFLICLLMVMIGKVIASLFHIQSPYFPLLMGGFEMGMLGYALFIALQGENQLDKIALIDLGQVIFVFFVLMALLIKEKEGNPSPGRLIKSFLTSPVILAIFSGIFLSFLSPHIEGNGLTRSLGEFIALAGQLTVPLISLLIGYELSFNKQGLLLAGKTIIVRYGLLITAALLMNHFLIDGLFGLEPIYQKALLTMFLMPPPFVIAIYMKQDDQENLNYVVNTLSLSTLVSVVLLTGFMVFI